MIETKIKLSAHELAIAQNADLILTKNAIIQKAVFIFSGLAENMQHALAKAKLSEEIKSTEPKISKGENYNGLPYVMLDYPRLFGKENIFAIRTLFWWGNYFNTTLHLKGIYKEMFAEKIRNNIVMLGNKNFYIGTSSDEWLHAHDESYVSLSCITEKSFEAIFNKNPFLKISIKTQLSEWDNCPLILLTAFKDILEAIGEF